MNASPHATTADTSATTLRRILKSAPQDLWLDTIRRTKGSTHDDLVHWMLGQPECDFAVAAYAFYNSDPASHLTDPQPLPPRPKASQTFAQVLLNWDMGFYRTHRLCLDDNDIDGRQIRRLNQKLLAWPKGALPFNIPTRLLDTEGGQPIDLPQHLSPDHASHLWPLYQALGLRVRPQRSVLRRRVAKATGLLNRVTFRSARP